MGDHGLKQAKLTIIPVRLSWPCGASQLSDEAFHSLPGGIRVANAPRIAEFKLGEELQVLAGQYAVPLAAIEEMTEKDRAFDRLCPVGFGQWLECLHAVRNLEPAAAFALGPNECHPAQVPRDGEGDVRVAISESFGSKRFEKRHDQMLRGIVRGKRRAPCHDLPREAMQHGNEDEKQELARRGGVPVVCGSPKKLAENTVF